MRAAPRTDPYVRNYLIRLLPWVLRAGHRPLVRHACRCHVFRGMCPQRVKLAFRFPWSVPFPLPNGVRTGSAERVRLTFCTLPSKVQNVSLTLRRNAAAFCFTKQSTKRKPDPAACGGTRPRVGLPSASPPCDQELPPREKITDTHRLYQCILLRPSCAYRLLASLALITPKRVRTPSLLNPVRRLGPMPTLWWESPGVAAWLIIKQSYDSNAAFLFSDQEMPLQKCSLRKPRQFRAAVLQQ